jgi:nucleoside-diphosphate-sugar epimerase
MSRTRIAITGAAGMIGSRLATNLARDHDVSRLDRPNADLLNVPQLAGALAGCAAVVHLAAGVLRDGSWQEVWEPNVLGARNLFEAARSAGCSQVIYGSSLHVIGGYEEAGRPRIYEPGHGIALGTDVTPRPANPYAVTKAFGETLARFFSEVHGMRVACIRIGTMNAVDSPHVLDAHADLRLGRLATAERHARLRAKWFSHADLARLVRAILARDVAFVIVYGVGDNPGRFVDLEPGRTLYGFWPRDGSA